MSWNYRVVKDEGHRFTIREVYYQGDIPVNHSDPVEPIGSNVEDLRQELVRMVEALDKPVLVEHITSVLRPLVAPEGQ